MDDYQTTIKYAYFENEVCQHATGNDLLPKKYPQDVRHQQDQAHIGGEPLCVLGPADVPVLGDVGHHATKHHGTSGDPQNQAVKHGHNLLQHLIFHVEMLSAKIGPLAVGGSAETTRRCLPSAALLYRLLQRENIRDY